MPTTGIHLLTTPGTAFHGLLVSIAGIIQRPAPSHLSASPFLLTLLSALHRVVTQAYAINRPFRSHF